MNDPEQVLVEWLNAQAALTSVFGNRMWAAPKLIADYKPANGPAVLFGVRGGGTDYTRELLQPSMQFRVYAATEVLARSATGTLWNALADARSAKLKFTQPEGQPQLLNDPETGWPFTLFFYTVGVSAN